MSKAPAKPAAQGDAAPKSKKKLIIMILAGLLVAGAGGGGAAWYFTRSHGPAEGAAADAPKPEPDKPPVFVTLEPFTVNLQPEEGDQYLQVGMTLKVGNAEVVDKITTHMPEVRNRILMVLSSKKASQIISTDGKKALSEEIVKTVSEPFSAKGEELKVASVLFTTFIVQ